MKMILSLLLLIPVQAKQKFKYVQKNVPVYIGISRQSPDVEDDLTKGLKNDLIKQGINVINNDEYIILVKRYFADAQENYKNLSDEDRKNASTMIRKVNGFGTPSQSIIINYAIKFDSLRNSNEIDSVGFSFKKYPFNSMNDFIKRFMFPISAIGSSEIDSVRKFILSKL